MIWGGGYCQRCQTTHLLPTSARAQDEVRARMGQVRAALNTRLGRMVGVLIAEDHVGREVILQAYSGTKQLPGLEIGWAGPTRRVDVTQSEEDDTFEALNRLSQTIEGLGWRSVVSALREAKRNYETEQQALQKERAHARSERARLRDLSPDDTALHAALRQTSWNESVAYRKKLKELRGPLEAAEARHKAVLDQLQSLRRERRVLSNRLQCTFNNEHELTNFKDVKLSIEDAYLPGVTFAPGAGECAAPKLLQDAVRRGLKPIAIAEVWVGPSHDEPKRIDGELYGPCTERCQPIMGHLLCGMERPARLPDALNLIILEEGEDWLAVSKPGRVLATPGRGPEKLDSVLTRVRRHYGRGSSARAVHRLDHETSGTMLLATDGEAQATIQAQFVARTTEKKYLAWVDGEVVRERGQIDLPLRSVGRFTREQEVHPDGKPALTAFRVLGHADGRSLVLFQPITGRSHQLRLHAAHPDGLGFSIRGDSLYGRAEEHLYLHAWTLAFDDPRGGERRYVQCPLPDYWPAITLDMLPDLERE